MKIKKFLSLMLLVLVAALLVACGDKAQDIANENLEKVSITYTTGDSASSVTSDVTLGKVELEGLTVEWQSDNAAISAEGKVTRPAAGGQDVSVKLTVTVKYKDATASKDFTLVVKALPEVKPLTVEITGTDKMVTGLTYTLTATVAPENATNKAVTWESDNTAVATVDADGKVTAVAPGTANIKATAKASASVVGTFAIEVADPTAESVEATIAKAAGEEGWTKGVVIATYARGFLISDGIACVLVYMNQTAFEQKVGDYVEVKGVLAEYNGSKQFTDSATITPLEEEAPKVEFKAEKLKDAAAVTAFMGAFVLDKKISLRVTVTSVSTSYVNAVVKDSEVAFAICYPVDSEAYVVGKDYDVTAYALYVKAYNNVDTLYVMAEKSIEVDYGFDVHVTYKDGSNEDAQTINSLEFPIMELPEPEEKEGFVWLGWFVGPEDAPVRVYSIDSPEDITLYTRWVAAEDAPLFVDPACEDGSAYTSITEAVEAAKEGQEIVLAPGEYQEDYIVPAERTYPTPEAILAAFGADFVEKNKLTQKIGETEETEPRTVDASLFETSTAESSWMTAFMDDPVLKEKWSWLFKGISEAAENEDLDPEYYVADQRFLLMANLYGFFTQTQHTETYSKSTVSADFTRSSLVQKVVLAGPKAGGEDAPDTILNKIYINKAVKITGPNANVHGHSESRNEEANIISTFIITANNVTIDGLEFSGDGYIQLGKDTANSVLKHVVINNCNIHTDIYGANPTGSNNRKGSIITHGTMEDLQILNTSIVFAGSSYTTVAIDLDGQGGTTGYTAKDIAIVGCYFESTNATAAAYEMIMGYNASGKFDFIGNEVRVGIDGYLIRIGYYKTWCNEINVIDNDFLGLGDLGGASIGFAAIDATNGMKINIVGNNFENLAPASFVFGEGTTTLGCTVNYQYNYFSNKQLWSIDALGSIVFNHSNNLTEGDYREGKNVVDIKANDNAFADKAALDEAYAAYKETLHTVKFDSDGGNNVLPIHFENAKDVKLPTPEKYGFVFGGWYDGETKVEKLAEAKDYNLKAKWLVTYYVVFDTLGGETIATIEFDTINTVVLPYGAVKVVEVAGESGKKYATVADVAADYVADFKTYAGGNLADATKIDTASIDSGSMVNMLKDATFNTKWAWLYNALFAAAGSPEGMEYTHADDTVKGFYLANLYGFFNGEKHTDTHLKTESADYSVEETVNAVLAAGPAAPVYKHMVITGWAEGETPVTAISELRNYNLKAVYTEANAITLDSDGAQDYETIYFADAALAKLPTPSKAGYYFLGWYEGETLVETIAEVKDYELVAHWRAVQTITVDPSATKKEYADTDAMLADFIAAYAAYYNVSDVTAANWSGKMEGICGAASWHYDDFFKANPDWAWFLDFYTALLNADATWKDGGDYGVASKYSWRQGFQAYATTTERTEWPQVAADSTLVTRSVDWAPYYAEVEAPISTLAAALEVAKAGDTIKLLAGVYDEEVEVAVNDLTIVGAKAYALDHADEYTLGVADTQVKNISADGVKGLTIKNIAMTKRIVANNVENLTIESVITTHTHTVNGDGSISYDGALYVSGKSKNINIKDFFVFGGVARVLYFATGTVTDVTIDHLVVMDAANVKMTEAGEYTAGICDVIRFASSNESVAAGNIVIKNCYFRAGQSGIMDRLPNADSYTLTNNYFYRIPAAVYFRAGTLKNAIKYDIQYNTFVECGNMKSDWDVLAITTSADTTVDVHYNAFIDSFFFNGTAADYVIKVRTAAGEVDCSNNYFKNLDEARSANLNAEGAENALQLVAKENAPQTYDPYKIMLVNKKIFVYGVNYEYVPANVKLDDADPIEVAVGFYTLPTPVKEGWDFQGWFEGETKVTEITEGRDYTLVSKWENFSKFYNVEGLTGFYCTYEEMVDDLLADINTFFGKSFTRDTITYETWSIVQYANMFIDAKYAQKWLPLLNVFVANASPCSSYIQPLVTMINDGQTTVEGNGWRTDSNPYALNYEVVGFVKGLENKKHSSLFSADWSLAANQAAAVAAYPPVKAGYTFDGWFEDEAFTTPAETIEKYGKNYYAKWTELPRYDVTLTLNGGVPYASVEEMIADFMAAYAAYYDVKDVSASNWSNKLEATCNAATWHYNDFFNANTEWSWFLTFYSALLEADTTWSYGADSKYSWRMALQAYATATERTAWPQVAANGGIVTRSVDWAGYYTATTFVIANTYGRTSLPTVYKAGYTFAGWFDNEACEGEAITKVSAAATLYAKWEEVTPAE